MARTIRRTCGITAIGVRPGPASASNVLKFISTSSVFTSSDVATSVLLRRSVLGQQLLESFPAAALILWPEGCLEIGIESHRTGHLRHERAIVRIETSEHADVCVHRRAKILLRENVRHPAERVTLEQQIERFTEERDLRPEVIVDRHSGDARALGDRFEGEPPTSSRFNTAAAASRMRSRPRSVGMLTRRGPDRVVPSS